MGNNLATSSQENSALVLGFHFAHSFARFILRTAHHSTGDESCRHTKTVADGDNYRQPSSALWRREMGKHLLPLDLTRNGQGTQKTLRDSYLRTLAVIAPTLGGWRGF